MPAVSRRQDVIECNATAWRVKAFGRSNVTKRSNHPIPSRAYRLKCVEKLKERRRRQVKPEERTHPRKDAIKRTWSLRQTVELWVKSKEGALR